MTNGTAAAIIGQVPTLIAVRIFQEAIRTPRRRKRKPRKKVKRKMKMKRKKRTRRR